MQPEQNRRRFDGGGDHNEEAGGVSSDCAWSAQNCDPFPGSEQFGGRSANPRDCETDSASEIIAAMPQKRPGAPVDVLETVTSDAELNVDETTGPPGTRQTSKDSGEQIHCANARFKKKTWRKTRVV